VTELKFRPYQASPQAFLQFIEERSSDVLANASNVSNADEKKAFEKRLDNFRASFDGFVEFIKIIDAAAPHLFVDVRPIQRLIWDAFLLGSGTGISKTAKEFHLTPIRRGGVAGGRKSTKTRTEKANIKYRNEARRLALEIWQSGPLSQDKLVSEIESRWQGNLSDLPVSQTLKRLIRKMQASGELPRLARQDTKPLRVAT
jgi:hypothetical protein